VKKALIYESVKVAEVYIADTFLKRLTGYMFRKKPHHEAILIKPCRSIHTFFMRFDIDVLFIGENMEIIRKIDGVKPGRIIPPIKGACMVLESGQGLIGGIKTGNRLEIRDIPEHEPDAKLPA